MAGPFPLLPIGALVGGPAPATPFQATVAQCSFRGVPFIVEESGGEVGRRGQFHEYPLRDIPYAEDLGRRGRRWLLHAYVLGDDAQFQADVLIAALEQPGPGMLVLPNGAPVLAQPDPQRPARYSMVVDKQRRVSFELAFVEAGQILYPGTAPDTQANSQTAANNIDASANSDLSAGAAQAGTPAGTAQIENIAAVGPGGVAAPDSGIPVTDTSQPTFGAQPAF